MAEKITNYKARISQRQNQRWLLSTFWGLVLLCFGVARSFGASFTVSLDRDSVVVGEVVALTLKFEGGAPQSVPAIPQVAGLQPASSFTTSIGPDGVTTSVQSYLSSFVATRAGNIVIPAITAEVNGQRLTSQPLQLKVLQSDPLAPPPAMAEQAAFLWLALPRKEVYLGEVVVAELRLYLRSGVADISNLQLPPLSGEGFNAGKYVQGQQFQRKVGNMSFTVLPLLFSLTAVKSGPLTLGPLKGSVLIYLGPVNPFRPTQRQQVALTVEQQTLSALPLPAQNVPPNFNGALGNYSMSVSAGPTNVAVGDPVTVRVQITGRGALDALTLPEQNAWQNFKTYPPTAKVETTDALGLQGAKTFEQIVSPQTTDIKELPAFSFSFFDPDAKAYRTLTNPPVALTVRPGAATPVPVIAATNVSAPETPATRDIVHIKPRLVSLAQIRPPLVQRPWFMLLQVVPVLTWLAAAGWRKRADALANNPRLRRQREVAQIIREGLAELHRHATENNSDKFFATLFRLLQEQLGERLDCPASSITEAVIAEKLRPRGVEENTLTTLHELFQTCNLVRYAPIKSSQELAAFIPKLETTLRELQNIRA